MVLTGFSEKRKSSQNREHRRSPGTRACCGQRCPSCWWKAPSGHSKSEVRVTPPCVPILPPPITNQSPRAVQGGRNGSPGKAPVQSSPAPAHSLSQAGSSTLVGSSPEVSPGSGAVPRPAGDDSIRFRWPWESERSGGAPLSQQEGEADTRETHRPSSRMYRHWRGVPRGPYAPCLCGPLPS